MRFGHVASLDLTIDLVGMDIEDEDDFADDFDIKTMVNLIGRPLTDGRFQYGLVINPAPEQLLPQMSMPNQLSVLLGQIGACIIRRSPGSIQGCVNKAVIFVASILINFTTPSGSVGIVMSHCARLIELTRMQAEITPALLSIRCLVTNLLAVERYPTGCTSPHPMN